ncbi:MAG: tRNA (adenosine(37)-N6)-threonylcarbamoyltransferase complex transferase subunit TsaD [Dehalococcoidia bacterium]|nr:tRNA (adenosine(37)-N6)-threonylcarbamoyltransferase complex transferase subunit TsaD [Dehalococcoidia bacterium]
MKILGIESSCDETAAAVVQDGTKPLSNVIASQVEIHSRYGGIVPEVASRQHMLSAIPILERTMQEAGVCPADLAAIAVTHGPGLAGSLLVGVNLAKALAFSWDLPLVGINHIEAHIYANWLGERVPEFPVVVLIVSGGHTDLVLMEGHKQITRLGSTRDDAAGEAFDKVARVLGLGYPGGPAIERASREGTPRFKLPRAWLRGTYDFSFSGLKTAVVRLAQDLGLPDASGSDSAAADIAASFQESVADILATKAIQAAREYEARQLLLAGGVAANSTLRETITRRSPVPVLIPDLAFCTDNAAMIASCGYFHLLAGTRHGFELDAVPGLRLA